MSDDLEGWNKFAKGVKKFPSKQKDFIKKYHHKNIENLETPNSIAIEKSDRPITPDIHDDVSEITLSSIGVLPAKLAKNIDKGALEIDATLDLHGKTLVQAHDILQAFLEKSFTNNKRLLLVITGKGKSSTDNDRPTIRGDFLYWLNSPTFRPYVLRVSQAQQKHGGGGAFYVYLKRNKQLHT